MPVLCALQGLSSRFEQLLYLGSLVFKEESGYIGYFYHLLKPNEHYLPVWREVRVSLALYMYCARSPIHTSVFCAP